jgi:hypothetical protein
VIRVTVELLPGGSATRKSELGSINIVNDGTGDEIVGNYDVTLTKAGRVVQHIRVESHWRDEGWGELLRLAITEGLAQQ